MVRQILAIDTSIESCSVALWKNGKVFTQNTISPKEHTKKILPMIKECLIKANSNLQNIDILAFGHGPGSFTGIRIAVGIAQGLAFGANLSVIGISSLLTIAQGVYRQLGLKRVLVTIDAKMGEVYSACYERASNGSWLLKDTEEVLKPKQFLSKINTLTGQWAIAGTGWSTYPILKMTKLNLLETSILFPNAQDILPLTLQEYKKTEMFHIEKAQPVYLRSEVTWKKLSNH